MEVIRKPEGQEPSEFELKVAEELQKLVSGDMKTELEGMYMLGAKEVDVPTSKKAIVILIPYKQLALVRKVQVRLVRELEKKMAGKNCVILPQRTIHGDSFNRSTKTMGVLPRSRTLTAVHEAILEDLVYPTEIVGKRTRYRVDTAKQLKVYLHPRDQVNTETKLETFAAVYKKLTSKDVVFEFPVEN